VLHAVLRPGRKAWVEQLVLGAALFVAVPLINALTTPWNLGVALMQGDWALAGFDLTCLATGLFPGVGRMENAARRQHRQRKKATSRNATADHS
jgi:hypothetical protein